MTSDATSNFPCVSQENTRKFGRRIKQAVFFSQAFVNLCLTSKESYFVNFDVTYW